MTQARQTKLKLADPGHLLVDDSEILYIADSFNGRIWAVRYAP